MISFLVAINGLISFMNFSGKESFTVKSILFIKNYAKLNDLLKNNTNEISLK
jgi:hypothetical protein